MFQPKLLTIFKSYSKKQFFADLTAGTLVGIVALPLAIAFAIASGVSPEKGLVTAVVGGFLISALGGSRVQIGGPTGAFVVIVYGVVQKYGVEGLAVATVMAGILLIVMGLLRMGSIIKFIPQPVVTGFTSGIALIIFSSQIRDFFGLQMAELPADFVKKWIACGHAFDTANFYAVAVGFFSLWLTLYGSRFSKKIPGPLIALIGSTLIVQIFHIPVETIASRFGDIPSTLPAPHIPWTDFAVFQRLIQPATTIALLAAIESLLSAVIADGMIGGRHRSNTELIGQGIANICSPLFGGIPVTGAIARTATNVKNGGRTPVAGMIHAVVLLFIMFFAGQWVKLIPLSCLAAILIVVAYNMSEWRSFRMFLKCPRSDVAVLLVTFILTVLVDLTFAIEMGVLIAAVMFIRRMTLLTKVGKFRNHDEEETAPLDIPAGVEIYEINGPLFFGAAEKFKEAMQIIETPPKVRIIRMRHVPTIDATGLHVLQEYHAQAKRDKGTLILSEVLPQPLEMLEESDFLKKLGRENVTADLETALEHARQLL